MKNSGKTERESLKNRISQVNQDLEKIDLSSKILNLLNGLDEESEKLIISKNGEVRIATLNKKNGQFRELKTVLFRIFKPVGSIPGIGSTSIASSPVKNPIKGWSGFGEEQKSAKKRQTKKDKGREIREKFMIGMVKQALAESKNPTTQRVDEPYHSYKVVEADNGYQLWYMIESKIKNDMVLKDGRVLFVKLSGKKIKIERPAGEFMGKLTL